MGRVVKCSMGKGMGMGMSMVMGQVVSKSMFMGEVMGVVDKVVRVVCEGMERVGKSVGQVRCCVRCRHSIRTTDQQVEFGLPRESLGPEGPKRRGQWVEGGEQGSVCEKRVAAFRVRIRAGKGLR